MKLYEMEGFLRGKCLPGDLLFNETNAQYLVRKFTELHDRIEVSTAALREKTKQCEQLAVDNAALKEFIHRDCLVPDINGYDKDAADFMPETPATDAFLREVRAQGVEMFADSKYCQDESQSGAHDFAAELRQGGAA